MSLKTNSSSAIGSSVFEKIRKDELFFVDKTLIIKDFFNSGFEVILVTRPRRWGKSLNMNVIKKFFEIEVNNKNGELPLEKKKNHELFEGTKIDSCSEMKEFFGRYPVIFFNFKGIYSKDINEMKSGFQDAINSLFTENSYLQRSERLSKEDKDLFSLYIDLKTNLSVKKMVKGILVLSSFLYKHFQKKVIILIDEYDDAVNYALTNKKKGNDEDFEEIIEMIKDFFHFSLKQNDYLEKALVTGILRIAKANFFSSLNNIKEFNVLNDDLFYKYYGFTQEEVDGLIAKIPTNTTSKKIKDWYNGYEINSLTVYNPWSIVNCLKSKGKLRNYWLESGSIDIFDKFFLSEEIQPELQKLLMGGTIVKAISETLTFSEIETNSDLAYSFLLYAGYLNAFEKIYDEEDEEDFFNLYALKIPNKEVRTVFKEKIITKVVQNLNINSNELREWISLLPKGEIENFLEELKYLLNNMSYHDLTKEKDYHNLMTGIFFPFSLTKSYKVISNRETGEGRADHYLIPIKSTIKIAYIFEYKYPENKENFKKLIPEVQKNKLKKLAQEALDQIEEKKYSSDIKEDNQSGLINIEKIYKIGIAFFGKELFFEIREELLKNNKKISN